MAKGQLRRGCDRRCHRVHPAGYEIRRHVDASGVRTQLDFVHVIMVLVEVTVIAERVVPVSIKVNLLICLCCVDNGRAVFESALDSPPVFDGMIAADKKLFISTANGSIVCLGDLND